MMPKAERHGGAIVPWARIKQLQWKQELWIMKPLEANNVLLLLLRYTVHHMRN
jgi:hypothetical protein